MLMFPFFPILFPHLIFSTHRTVGGFIDSIIKDEDLKLTLLANIGYYHDDPYSASLIYFSVGQANYYNGGYFIKGGSQKLSDDLPVFTNTDKRIDKDLLVKHVGDLKKYTFYIVGTSEFTHGMTLLLQNHVESSKIKIDDFG